MKTLQNIYKKIEMAISSQGKAMHDNEILFLGLCHKCGLDHIHEPISIKIMEMV